VIAVADWRSVSALGLLLRLLVARFVGKFSSFRKNFVRSVADFAVSAVAELWLTILLFGCSIRFNC
jgi:hypothetical protein